MMWQYYRLDSCYFQDDNANCFIARSTMDLYGDKGVNWLDWSAQSNNLNLDENFLDKFNRRIKECDNLWDIKECDNL